MQVRRFVYAITFGVALGAPVVLTHVWSPGSDRCDATFATAPMAATGDEATTRVARAAAAPGDDFATVAPPDDGAFETVEAQDHEGRPVDERRGARPLAGALAGIDEPTGSGRSGGSTGSVGGSDRSTGSGGSTRSPGSTASSGPAGATGSPGASRSIGSAAMTEVVGGDPRTSTRSPSATDSGVTQRPTPPATIIAGAASAPPATTSPTSFPDFAAVPSPAPSAWAAGPLAARTPSAPAARPDPLVDFLLDPPAIATDPSWDATALPDLVADASPRAPPVAPRKADGPAAAAVTVTVPEPPAFTLLAFGVAALALRRARGAPTRTAG